MAAKNSPGALRKYTGGLGSKIHLNAQPKMTAGGALKEGGRTPGALMAQGFPKKTTVSQNLKSIPDLLSNERKVK